MAIVIDADPRSYIDVRLVGVDYRVYPPKASFSLEMARNAQDLQRKAERSQSKKTKKGNPATRTAQDVDTSSALASVKMLEDWVDQAFGDQAKDVHARLADPKDALDLPHIGQLIEAVTEEQTGGPTT